MIKQLMTSYVEYVARSWSPLVENVSANLSTKFGHCPS